MRRFLRQQATTSNKIVLIHPIYSKQIILEFSSAPDQKHEDYHHVQMYAFKPIVDLQQKPGLSWNLNCNAKQSAVLLKMPILFITGNSEGQHKLAGRRQIYYNFNESAHSCRYCIVPYEQTDNPYHPMWITKAQIFNA
jgi:hypothetical protein